MGDSEGGAQAYCKLESAIWSAGQICRAIEMYSVIAELNVMSSWFMNVDAYSMIKLVNYYNKSMRSCAVFHLARRYFHQIGRYLNDGHRARFGYHLFSLCKYNGNHVDGCKVLSDLNSELLMREELGFKMLIYI